MDTTQILEQVGSLNMVARRLQTLATFEAEDPWNADRQTEFRIEECTMAMKGKKELTPRSGGVRVIALWSTAGGREHFVPESLVELWRAGKLPAPQLPRLVQAAEKKLMEADYYLVLHDKWQNRTGWIAALIGFVIAFGGMRLGMGNESLPLPATLVISCAFTALCGGAGALKSRIHRLRCREQMRWALAEGVAMARAEGSGDSRYRPRGDGLKSRLRFFMRLYFEVLGILFAALGAGGVGVYLVWK